MTSWVVFELMYRDMEMNSIEEPQLLYDGTVELEDDATLSRSR